MKYRALAPAKINLGLFLGPAREQDARHELVSVMQSISLADELTLEALPGGARDELICPGVPGPPAENLAAAALRLFRESTGWHTPAVRLLILKRIPVAAGLGGGSADAAATLRLLAHASGQGDETLLMELAARLGADVPAQLAPGRWLASGAGERLQALPDAALAFAVLVLAAPTGLSTAGVYAEADRLGLARSLRELDERREALHAALARGEPLPRDRGLLHNDLERAARSLCPQIASALEQARAAGASAAVVSGSGPTVLGLFEPSADGQGESVDTRALAAVRALAGRQPPALCAGPVTREFARALRVGECDDAGVRNNPGGIP